MTPPIRPVPVDQHHPDPALPAGPDDFHPCPPDDACPHCRGTATRPPDWSWVDAVYCISLRERPDRAAAAAAELHRAGLCRRALFHRPRRHPTKVIEGIWEAHRRVLAHALAAGAETALVLEDDVHFTGRITRGRIAGVAAAMRRLPDDWRIFFLGHWTFRARLVAPRILATRSACAHAYVASRALMTWAAERPFAARGTSYFKTAGGGIDAAYAVLPGSYAYFPMLATQAIRGSDHVAEKQRTRPIRKLKHIVTRTRLNEIAISRLMRANELLMVAIGVIAGTGERLGRRFRRPG
ncbi:MAG: hypothetical protein R3D25_17840 [Geminicoccaceae bacterium]